MLRAILMCHRSVPISGNGWGSVLAGEVCWSLLSWSGVASAPWCKSQLQWSSSGGGEERTICTLRKEQSSSVEVLWPWNRERGEAGRGAGDILAEKGALPPSSSAAPFIHQLLGEHRGCSASPGAVWFPSWPLLSYFLISTVHYWGRTLKRSK